MLNCFNIEANLRMSLKKYITRTGANSRKPYVGLEVPNVDREIVAFGNVVSDPILNSKNHCILGLGADIDRKHLAPISHYASRFN